MSNFVDIFRITGITRQMSNKKFYFDQAVAQDCGLKEAVLYEYIRFWCEKNKKAGRNYNDGHHWTYGSANTLADQFPFFTPKRLRFSAEKASTFILLGPPGLKSHWFS